MISGHCCCLWWVRVWMLEKVAWFTLGRLPAKDKLDGNVPYLNEQKLLYSRPVLQQFDAQKQREPGGGGAYCFLHCNPATGEISSSEPGRRLHAGIQLPPNLTAYRVDTSAGHHRFLPTVAVVTGYHRQYALYANPGFSDVALMHLVATECSLNAHSVQDWHTFVVNKLTCLKEAHGFTEAYRWLRLYRHYLEQEPLVETKRLYWDL
jgi:hypothetical protein